MESHIAASRRCPFRTLNLYKEPKDTFASHFQILSFVKFCSPFQTESSFRYRIQTPLLTSNLHLNPEIPSSIKRLASPRYS